MTRERLSHDLNLRTVTPPTSQESRYLDSRLTNHTQAQTMTNSRVAVFASSLCGDKACGWIRKHVIG